VRITVQLIDAESGAQLWSEAYEDDLEDIFGIQLAIATQIANALELEFSPEERQRIGRKPTDNPKAYGHYLRALSGWGNLAATGPIHEALDAAISLDPNFAEALALKALIHSFEASNGTLFFGKEFRVEDQARFINLAEQLAIRALELDDKQALANSALTSAHGYYREWEALWEVNERTYALSSQNYLLAPVGVFLAFRDGDQEKAVRLADHAVSLNPADAAAVWYYSTLFYKRRIWDEAIEKADLVVALIPEAALGYAQLARIYGKLGNEREMRRNATLAEARNPTLRDLIDVALAYGHIGDVDEAKRIFDLASVGGDTSNLNNEALVWMHMAVGDYDAAMHYLEQAIHSNFPYGLAFNLHTAPNQPDYDPIRSRPEFDRLLQHMAEPLR
jgi:adenylate cyclase